MGLVGRGDGVATNHTAHNQTNSSEAIDAEWSLAAGTSEPPARVSAHLLHVQRGIANLSKASQHQRPPSVVINRNPTRPKLP